MSENKHFGDGVAEEIILFIVFVDVIDVPFFGGRSLNPPITLGKFDCNVGIF